MTISTTVKAVRGALLTAALLLAAAAPAQAAARHSFPANWLYLTVTTGDARSGHMRGTLLLCDPPQGHAHAAEACAELRAADGDIGALPEREVFCTMVYAPVTVRARGVWDGRAVHYTRTFSNRCALGARTGTVFELDD